jgi:hypothetical protein
MPAAEYASMPQRPATASGPHIVLCRLFIALGILPVIYSVALTTRAYMACPEQDQWGVLDSILRGREPWHLSWLWSQHYEHRIAITRLLIWADWTFFGGVSVSLLVETYIVQSLHCWVIWYALRRSESIPWSLRYTLQGLFMFCLFHPNQAHNFVWPFQVSFVLPFGIGTLALLGTAFFHRMRHPILASLCIAVAPMFAALNLAGGLLIGPVVLCLAWGRRLPRTFLITIALGFLTTSLLYLHGYQAPPGNSSPLESIQHPILLLNYVLSYLDGSFPAMPHHPPMVAAVSVLLLTYLAVRFRRSSGEVSDFEWFCFAECALVLGTAVITGLGRLSFGANQATFSSRYQTPAMLYWASLFSLVAIGSWRSKKESNPAWLLAPVAFWILMMPFLWRVYTGHADILRHACSEILKNPRDLNAAQILNGDPRDPRWVMEEVATSLRARWRTNRSPSHER